MALSDQLSKLSEQAKHLEESAEELHTENQAKVQARLTELRTSLDQAQRDIDAQAHADAESVAAGWADLQKSVSDGFAEMKADMEARQAGRKAKRADKAADQAEYDAADAIDWAVYALEEAEYYVLAAAQARADADAAAAASST
jgi:uncharacterized membrane-anchored protein YhcB (DUF1043 family)